MIRRHYRRRADGVIELIPPRRLPFRELVVSGLMAAGGIALTVAFAALVASSVRADNFRRTAGVASVCYNWSVGPSGCWTR